MPPNRVSLPRKGHRVGLRIVLFEACSAFTRVTACTLALSPIRDTHSEGFSYLVTSIAAPAASGWSVAGWGLHPQESAAFSRRTPRADSFSFEQRAGCRHEATNVSSGRRCVTHRNH